MFKFLWFAIFILQFAVLRAQPGTNLYDTRFAFNSGTLDGASVTTDANGFKVLLSDDADSVLTQEFIQKQMKGGGSLYIHARSDTLKATTGARKLEMLLWRGESYTESGKPAAFLGWEFHGLASWSAGESGDAGIVLMDSTWFSKKPTTKWKFLYTEAAADSNLFYLDQFHYQSQK